MPVFDFQLGDYIKVRLGIAVRNGQLMTGGVLEEEKNVPVQVPCPLHTMTTPLPVIP